MSSTITKAKRNIADVSTPKRTKFAAGQKKKKNNSLVRISRAPKVGFPQKTRMVHRYVDVGTLDYTAPDLNVAYLPYSCNGMYDPYLNIGGHQPMYFDELCAIYNHYTVVQSKITVEFSIDTSAAPGGHCVCGIYIDDDSTPAFLNLYTVCEDSSCVSGLTNQSNNLVVTKTWNSYKYFGGSALSNDNLQGTNTSNPDEQSVYIVFVRSADGATSLGVQYKLTIEYDAIWDELKSIGSS